MIESHPAAFFDSLIFGLRFFISCHNTFYHHTTVVLKPQGPAKKLIIDLRPTYHPMADSEIFRKTHPAAILRSAILHVGTLFFWLNAVHPYVQSGFKSRRPEEKLIIDLRPTYHPMADSEIFPKTHPAPELHSAILHVGTLFFWLNAVHPYDIQTFKSRRPEEKLTIDIRPTEPPTTNFYFSLR